MNHEITVQPLTHVTKKQIVECLNLSFADYSIKMPSDLAFWEKRWDHSGIDFNVSFGAFDGDILVGFILHAIGTYDGSTACLNDGTGVIPEYRGRKLVDQIYSHAFEALRGLGVQLCLLEVIQSNIPAIKVYERNGFQITRELICVQGEFRNGGAELNDLTFKSIDLNELTDISPQAWNNSLDRIKQHPGHFDSVFVCRCGKELGYFIKAKDSHNMLQVIATGGTYHDLVLALSQKLTSVRMINIDKKNARLIEALEAIGVKEFTRQYEMSLILN